MGVISALQGNRLCPTRGLSTTDTTVVAPAPPTQLPPSMHFRSWPIFQPPHKPQPISNIPTAIPSNEMHDHVKDATKKLAKEIEALIKKGTQYLDRNPEGDSDDFDTLRIELNNAFKNLVNNPRKKSKPASCYKPVKEKR